MVKRQRTIALKLMTVDLMQILDSGSIGLQKVGQVTIALQLCYNFYVTGKKMRILMKPNFFALR